MVNNNILNIINDFSVNYEVETITIGGSMTHDFHDENSNYDIFVYVKNKIDENFRLNIYKKYCSYIEIGNEYIDYQDDGITLDKVSFSIKFKNLDTLIQEINDILRNYKANLGNSTLLVSEVLTSRVMFDRYGRYYKLQYESNIPYPLELKNKIINKNFRILSGFLPSYLQKFEIMLKRNDKIHYLNLMNRFFLSYFDVLFAINEKYHPGDKYLLSYIKKLDKLPDNIFLDLETVYNNPFDEKTILTLAKMVNSLKVLI